MNTDIHLALTKRDDPLTLDVNGPLLVTFTLENQTLKFLIEKLRGVNCCPSLQPARLCCLLQT